MHQKFLNIVVGILFAANNELAIARGIPIQGNTEIGDTDTTHEASVEHEAIILARGAELSRIANLYNIDMTHVSWGHELLDVCPAFSDHFFVRYHANQNPNGDFIAIYPGHVGRIRIIRLGTEYRGSLGFASIRKSTIMTFNAIQSEERSGPYAKNISMDHNTMSEGICYAEISGEKLRIVADEGRERHEGQPPFDIDQNKTSIVVFEILGNPSLTTSLSLNFDKSGYVTSVSRTESNKPLR